MKIFDPHIHMTSRTAGDYVAMAERGVFAVCEPAFWLGQPRTHVGTYEDYLQTIIGWERYRASQFGIHHFCTIGLNPKEANDSNIADGVIELLSKYCYKENVLGIGEIGFDEQTESEAKYFKIQLELAKKLHLPVIIHTPHRDKKRGTEKSIDLIKETGISQEMVVIDHNTEETISIVLSQTNCWAGHTIYSTTKMTKERMLNIVKKYGINRIIINSSADWGVSDALSVTETDNYMKENGIPEESLEQIFWQNTIKFLSQSGKLNLDEISKRPEIDQSHLWQGNTILRGSKES